MKLKTDALLSDCALHMQQEVRLYDFCSEFFVSDHEYCTFFMLVVVVVVVLVAAAATMLSNNISLQVTWDWEQLHLQHFLLEHKFYSFWHYKVTIGGTALHPCNYF